MIKKYRYTFHLSADLNIWHVNRLVSPIAERAWKQEVREISAAHGYTVDIAQLIPDPESFRPIKRALLSAPNGDKYYLNGNNTLRKYEKNQLLASPHDEP